MNTGSPQFITVLITIQSYVGLKGPLQNVALLPTHGHVITFQATGSHAFMIAFCNFFCHFLAKTPVIKHHIYYYLVDVMIMTHLTTTLTYILKLLYIEDYLYALQWYGETSAEGT